MKNFAALLSAAVLSASTLAAHAAPLSIFGTGVSVLLDGNVLNTANVNLIQNGFTVLDHGSLFTVTYVTTPTIGAIPGVGILNVTDLCTNVSVGFGGASLGTPCSAQALSFTDANFGGVAIGVAAALGGQETLTATGNTAHLLVSESASIGLDSASFTFTEPVSTQPPTSNPVPEPGTLSMMATGLLGAAGALRRKFLA